MSNIVHWLRQHELRKHSDMVMLRGEDTYANLPNKTVGSSLLWWCMSEEFSYTHVDS